MDDPNIGLIFLSELVGTAMLVLLGCGVVANVVLKGNKGFGGGFLMINFGWAWRSSPASSCRSTRARTSTRL